MTHTATSALSATLNFAFLSPEDSMIAKFFKSGDGELGIEFAPETSDEQLILSLYTDQSESLYTFVFSGWGHNNPPTYQIRAKHGLDGLTQVRGTIVRKRREIAPSVRHHVAWIDPDHESMRRGGSCRTAACSCGWRGAQRCSLEMAADDALTHERVAHADDIGTTETTP